MGDEIVRLGAGPSIHYALRDTYRDVGNTTVYRISAEGTLRELGTLIPVRPDGYVMVQSDGKSLHCEGCLGGFTICAHRAIWVGRMRQGMLRCWGYQQRSTNGAIPMPYVRYWRMDTIRSATSCWEMLHVMPFWPIPAR